MNPLQFGSGTPQLGGADPVAAINEAIQRRQTGQAGVTDQSSMSQTPMPQSPTGATPMPTPQPGQAPQSPQPAPMGAQPLPGESPVTVDRKLILKTLANQLDHYNKMDQAQLGGGM